MSVYCYLCDYNFTSALKVDTCPGCGELVDVDECSCWPKADPKVSKEERALQRRLKKARRFELELEIARKQFILFEKAMLKRMKRNNDLIFGMGKKQ